VTDGMTLARMQELAQGSSINSNPFDSNPCGEDMDYAYSNHEESGNDQEERHSEEGSQDPLEYQDAYFEQLLATPPGNNTTANPTPTTSFATPHDNTTTNPVTINNTSTAENNPTNNNTSAGQNNPTAHNTSAGGDGANRYPVRDNRGVHNQRAGETGRSSGRGSGRAGGGRRTAPK